MKSSSSSRAPRGAGVAGSLLPGDLAPGLPIRPYGGVDISIAVSLICVNNNNNKGVSPKVALCLVIFTGRTREGGLMAALDAGTSAAKRRRERRLRSWWRHERMSIAAVLATVSHHSYPKVDAPRGQKTVTSTTVGPAEYYELSSDDGRPTRGELLAALSEPWPQGKIEGHAGIAYELVQALDAPVLQMVEQLPNVLQFFLTRWPVGAEQVWNCEARQVIDVPKISKDWTQQRLVDTLRQPQMAEQLVEVPTIVSYPLHGLVEQNVDIPVPHVRGGRVGVRGLQGFH